MYIYIYIYIYICLCVYICIYIYRVIRVKPTPFSPGLPLDPPLLRWDRLCAYPPPDPPHPKSHAATLTPPPIWMRSWWRDWDDSDVRCAALRTSNPTTASVHTQPTLPFHSYLTRVWEVVRTVAAPPSIVVKCAGVVLRVFLCVVLVVSCVVWCCSCRMFVCVTCFSSYSYLMAIPGHLAPVASG